MVNTYKLGYTQLQIEIFRLLCRKSGEKLNQRQIAAFLDVSPAAVSKAIPLLIKQDLINFVRSENMNLTQIRFNNSNTKAVQLKRIENLRYIYESNFVEFFERTWPGCTIVLFGSYSRGEDSVRSDIDVAIVGVKLDNRKRTFVTPDPKKEELNSEKAEKFNLERFPERKIRMNLIDDLRKIKKELRENICNGIVLSGGIEL